MKTKRTILNDNLEAKAELTKKVTADIKQVEQALELSNIISEGLCITLSIEAVNDHLIELYAEHGFRNPFQISALKDTQNEYTELKNISADCITKSKFYTIDTEAKKGERVSVNDTFGVRNLKSLQPTYMRIMNQYYRTFKVLQMHKMNL